MRPSITSSQVARCSRPNTGNPGAYVVDGTFADVGTLDTYTVVVTWGPLGSTNANLGVGVNSFAMPYWGNPADLAGITISVTVTDDDSGAVNGTIVLQSGDNHAPVITTLTNNSPGCGCSSHDDDDYGGDDDGCDGESAVREGTPLTLTGAFIDVTSPTRHRIIGGRRHLVPSRDPRIRAPARSAALTYTPTAAST